ncbi:MAG TPA: hypothetical protein VFN97_01745 [Actinospica sp.]|nr:hypothetical protein [Actinospica sp.]
MTLDQYVTTALPASTDAHSAFEGFLTLAAADPHVLGVVLSGSQAREGMAKNESDYDAYVVLDENAPAELAGLDGFRSAYLDLSMMTMPQFRAHAHPDDASSWDAYAFVGAKVVLDRTDGVIGRLAAEKAVLTEEHARRRVAAHLDAYTNFTYRSFKDHRDGRFLAARLDAAESIPHLLTTLFALHRRVRPYNKYLSWELEHRPLGQPCWSANVLLPRLEHIRAEADPAAQRAVFSQVERAARSQGHGAMLDAWGDDLHFLRAAPAG